MSAVFALLYPFTAFVFVRLALRSFAGWATNPRWWLVLLGGIFAVATCHAGWMLFAWSAVLPHWWITPLIAIAFAWVVFKNIREIWKFEKLLST